MMTYCEAILRVLNLLARGAPGTLLLAAPGYPSRAVLRLETTDVPTLPVWVLDALEADREIRVSPALLTDDCREPVAVTTLYARFHPVVAASDDKGGFDVLDAVKIRDALAGFLPPAVLVDALREVVALWPLAEPLRDMAKARDFQRRIAERLGGAITPEIEMGQAPQVYGGPEIARPPSRKVPADDPGAFVSLAGRVRSAGVFAPWVAISLLDAGRAYTVDEITAALSPLTETETTPRKKARA
jgi:hypothetical protein